MRKLVIVAALAIVPLCLFADTAEVLKRVDALHDQGAYADSRTIALEAVADASPAEKAELNWRVARATMELGNQAEDSKAAKDAILKIFEEGEKYADMAIAADPSNNLGYYWKSSNIGRWGQVKGILDSLFKAGPMRDLLVKDLALDPTHADAYYVLGQLYRELPGWPLSFGNLNAAVSLGRMAIDLRADQLRSGREAKLNYSFFVELGKTLWKRNWSAATRLSEQKKLKAAFDASKTPLEKGSVYEASVTLASVSDREEARTMLEGAIGALEQMASRTVGEDKDLKEARETLAGWK